MSATKAGCSDCLILPDMSLYSFSAMKLPYPSPPEPAEWRKMPAATRLLDLDTRVKPLLLKELSAAGFRLGSPIFLRGFKESRELELWIQVKSGWKLFRTYPIAAASGKLGPKLQEGDGQVPEGCYFVTAPQMNPASNYHLALNIGYPNAYDREHLRTGSLIMIHGSNVSIGCLAMTDAVIEEVYLIAAAAQADGQSHIPVHLYPFQMTPERMSAAVGDESENFWRELLPIYESFEKRHVPPSYVVQNGRYELKR